MQAGQVFRQYTYGNDLISQRQFIGGNWVVSYYGYDGRGSVRLIPSRLMRRRRSALSLSLMKVCRKSWSVKPRQPSARLGI